MAKNSIADAINAGLQGFMSGRQLKQQSQDKALAEAMTLAKINEMTRKSDALAAPVPTGSLRDPYSGRVIKDPSYLNPLEQAKLDALSSKAEDAKLKQANQNEMVTNSAEDMLKTVEEVKKGINYFGPLGDVPSVPVLTGDYASRKNWEVNVNKLLSGKIVDLMNQMKQASKTGATGFGALSGPELAVLKNASTALKRNLSPKDASRYLNDIESMQNKILSGKRSSGLPQNPSIVKQSSGLPERKQSAGKYQIVSVA